MGVTKRMAATGLVAVAAGAFATASRTLATGAGPPAAQAGGLGPSEAASLAVKYASAGVPAGRLVAGPTQINVVNTTRGEAHQLMLGEPLETNSLTGQDRQRAVWLVFLRGDIVLPGQQYPGRGASPARTIHQMAVVLDAGAGELLGGVFFPPDSEVAAASRLPAVRQPLPDVPVPRLVRTPVPPLPPPPPGVMPIEGGGSIPAAPTWAGYPHTTPVPMRASPPASATATPVSAR